MRNTAALVVAAVLLVACENQAQTPSPAAAVENDPQAVLANLQAAIRDLPDGAGKQLTAIACTRCHNLSGLAAYKGYWSRAQWLAMVENMVKHGAVLDAAQTNMVTDYLNSKYGRPTSEYPQ